MVTKEPLSMYESVAELPEFVGTAWRAESGYWHAPGTTVADIIRFEREELGNDYPDISDKLLQNLDHYSASDAVWVNRRRKECLRYLSEGESEEAVGRVHLPKGSKIIAPDYCGGYLVLRGLAEPIKPEIIAKPPAVESMFTGITSEIKPFRGRTAARGGNITWTQDGKEIGSASVAFEHKATKYPLSGDVPSGTAVVDRIEIEEALRGKGYGTQVMLDIERQARGVGMKRIYATAVMEPGFFEKMGYTRIRGRVWVKDITQTPPVAPPVEPAPPTEVAVSKPPAIEEVKKVGNPMPSANDLMPMSPTEGPPLPKGLRLKWPWRKP